MSRKEDRPEGAEDGDPASLRAVSPSGPPGSTRGPVRAQGRRVGGGSGYSKAREPGRTSCLQGPGPERYSAAGPNPSPSVDGCAAAPARRPLRSPDASRRARARGGPRSGAGSAGRGLGARQRALLLGQGEPQDALQLLLLLARAPPPLLLLLRRQLHGQPQLLVVAPEHVAARAWARAGPRAGDRRQGCARYGLALRRGRSAPAGQVKRRLGPICPEARREAAWRPSDTAGLATHQRICESSQAAFGLGKDATLTPAGSPMRGPWFLWAMGGCPAGSGRTRCGQGPGRVLYVCGGGGGGIDASKPSQDGRAPTCPAGGLRRTWGECPVCCW